MVVSSSDTNSSMDSQAKPWDLLTEFKKQKAPEQTLGLFKSLI